MPRYCATANRAAASISTVRQPSARRAATLAGVSRNSPSVVHVSPVANGTPADSHAAMTAATPAGDASTVRDGGR